MIILLHNKPIDKPIIIGLMGINWIDGDKPLINPLSSTHYWLSIIIWAMINPPRSPHLFLSRVKQRVAQVSPSQQISWLRFCGSCWRRRRQSRPRGWREPWHQRRWNSGWNGWKSGDLMEYTASCSPRSYMAYPHEKKNTYIQIIVMIWGCLPSGKHTHNYGKSPC